MSWPVLTVLLACGGSGPAEAPEPTTLEEKRPSPAMPMDHDPAAPDVSCDTSCHTTPHYDLATKHSAAECTTCHVREDQRKAELAAAEGRDPGPRGPFEGTLVSDQHEQRRRLKGAPIPLSESPVPVPEGMVFIPEGPFIMGSNLRWQDESPEHVVQIHAYFIDQTEVTNAAYREFVQATERATPQHWEGGFPDALAKHPVTYVDWNDAVAYCTWAGKRLPTEEEWEKGARGTDGRQYPWGEVFSAHRTNNPQKDSTGTEPVGSYESGRSPYGLYDMSGNVWEWVDSWYTPHPGNSHPSSEYGTKSKISKGGSWWSCLGYNCGISAPSYNRAFLSVPTKNASLGFRCVKEVTP